MVIAKRRRPEGESPEETHVAFAVSGPSFDVKSLCPRRWGIEIGYRLSRQTRMRTSGRNENARISCFVLSPVVHNARAMPHPGRRAVGDSRRIPAMSLKFLIVLGACNEFGARPRLRPPRRPPP